VWFYQLNLDRNLGKTNPLNENDLAEFVTLQKTFADSENSWTINISDIAPQGLNTQAKGNALCLYDLSVKNPNKKEEVALRQPQAILEEMKSLDEESAEILNSILELI
ncbi:MAG TPA: SAM-dependent DNA methyltransferase, partial [Saprospiraceae bacterium]|nr:SAM-dependent DNA methyltransferase [Saprospiraceae bacterium]